MNFIILAAENISGKNKLLIQGDTESLDFSSYFVLDADLNWELTDKSTEFFISNSENKRI